MLSSYISIHRHIAEYNNLGWIRSFLLAVIVFGMVYGVASKHRLYSAERTFGSVNDIWTILVA